MQAPSLNASSISYPLAAELACVAKELTAADFDEVLSFLGSNSLHTAYLTALILDNGITSPNNRGVFYGYRNGLQQLEGVALIGHAIVMEANTDHALQSFAEVAQNHTSAHMILSEENRIQKFWSVYASAGQEMRRASRHLLFELRWPTEVAKPKSTLRLANLNDLDQLIPVHAGMAQEESGVDPRAQDPQGFAQRYARRIEKGGTWISMVDGKLVFKAEVVIETPGITHIEGVWVAPEFRRQRYG